MLKVNSPLVSVNWLHTNINAENLIVLDATIAKVGSRLNSEKIILPKAQFFDIKKVFSKQDAKYPNTILTSEEFQAEAQKIGVNNNSCIVVYDSLGVYSSPRVWWMFNLMGFNNIAVLNGGLPEWKKANFSIEKAYDYSIKKGNFKLNYKPEKLKITKEILLIIKNKESLIIDARSKGRFNVTEPEPRKEVRGGHIPNSVNLPYTELLINGKFKSSEEIENIFNKINSEEKELVFSCGSGITACILALGATLINKKRHSVYDGSWTEWGSRIELPIQK